MLTSHIPENIHLATSPLQHGFALIAVPSWHHYIIIEGDVGI